MALSIPSRKQPGPASFPVDPEGVRSWITTLHPLSNIDNCRALYRGLKHSNRLETENRKRVAIADLFEPAVIETIDTLKSQVADLSQPLPAKAERHRQLALELLTEQAFLYKIIVHDTYASLLERQPQFRLDAVFKALKSLASLIEFHLLCQSEPDPALLQDANALFLLAEQSDLAQSEITLDDGDEGQLWNIENAFVFVQLLAMAQPWNQRPRQIPALIAFLEAQTTNLSIHPYDPESGDYPDSVFGIQLEQDGRAQLLKHAPRHTSDTLRLLDIAPLLEAIEATHKRTPESVNVYLEGETLSRTALTLLGESLSRKNTRRYARAITRKSVYSEIGLPNITAAVRFASETEVESGTAAIAATSNIWPQTPVHREHRWVVTNENRFGACLEWLDKDPTDAAVGEVIALKRNNRDAEPSWVTGIIRWLKAVAPNRLQIGIEFLAGETQAINIDNTVENLTTTHACLQATLLPGVLQDHFRTVLVAPPSLFRSGDTVGSGDQNYELGEKVLATAGFEMYGFSVKQEELAG